MKQLIFSFLLLLSSFVSAAQSNVPKTAYLIIDIQYFYFEGGQSELVNPIPASLKSAEVLKYFRNTNQLVVHVKHQAEQGGDIHANVAPLASEKVITKKYANSFKDTDLLEYLMQNGIKRLVISGMQTHMCLEAATRAASDFGFECIVIDDACATKDLTYDGYTVSAKDVHYSTLKTLSGTYAKVMKADEFLKSEKPVRN